MFLSPFSAIHGNDTVRCCMLELWQCFRLHSCLMFTAREDNSFIIGMEKGRFPVLSVSGLCPLFLLVKVGWRQSGAFASGL